MESPGAVAQTPGTTGAPGGLCGQHTADAASAELPVALRPASPLPPDGGAKPPPHPLVKASGRGRCCAEAEVAVPSVEVDGEVFDPPFEANALNFLISTYTYSSMKQE